MTDSNSSNPTIEVHRATILIDAAALLENASRDFDRAQLLIQRSGEPALHADHQTSINLRERAAMVRGLGNRLGKIRKRTVSL